MRVLIFFYEILKMKFFSSLMLKNFSSHLTWKLFWTPFHNWSPLFQWTWTRKTSCYKRVYHSALQAMKHGLREHWTLETARNREVSIIRNCPSTSITKNKTNFTSRILPCLLQSCLCCSALPLFFLTAASFRLLKYVDAAPGENNL